jgi:hypothetical protein
MRAGRADYSIVTRKSKRRKGIWRSDYSIVTHKFNRGKEIRPSRCFSPVVIVCALCSPSVRSVAGSEHRRSTSNQRGHVASPDSAHDSRG